MAAVEFAAFGAELEEKVDILVAHDFDPELFVAYPLSDDTLLLAVESRTSSPVRIVRDEHFESSIKGIYPCGEGAGYAGGITSAAIDGIKVFEEIYKRYHPL